MPCSTELPAGDYLVIVSRANRRPRAEAISWSLRDPLPAIPIPLQEGDPEIRLELQPIFTARYDRAAYNQTLDYSQPPSPPFSEADAAWAMGLVAK